MSRYVELEYKFDADEAELSIKEFNRVGQLLEPSEVATTSGPDVYYAHGPNVVRHRWRNGGGGELTVKQRKGRNQIVDRVEVDLRFAADMRLCDVSSFLEASGFKRALTLITEQCRVYTFEDEGADIQLAYYTVEKLNSKGRRVSRRSFVEVEVDKGASINDKKARVLLDTWATDLRCLLNLKSPLKLSLYEIYTGKRYTTAKKGK